jgi:quercetin dioxygenase-like cupin family protein
MKNSIILSGLFILLGLFSGAQENLVSKVYLWEDLMKTKLSPGKERTILEGSTPLFENIKVCVLIPGKKESSGIRTMAENEELVIVKDGVADVVLNGVKSTMSAGDVMLVCAGDGYSIVNGSDKPAACFVFRWKTRSTPLVINPDRKSTIYRWDDLSFVPSERGGRKNVLQRSTARLNEIEIHATTLNAYLPSHAAHTHPDDEFILVKTGNVEMAVSGIPYKAGAGSLYFLKGEDPHGICNIGDGTCEYYAIRMK